MTDLEITRICAEAMGFKVGDTIPIHRETASGSYPLYDPLHDDAQAMALVERFKLALEYVTPSDYLNPANTDRWIVKYKIFHTGNKKDLNRAICECVVKMQAAK